MVAPAVALAVAAAGTKLIGGFIGAAQAKARAAYTSALYQQQSDLYSYMADKKIAQETGTAVANVTNRGVANSGTVLTRILADNFNNQLEKQFRIQDIQRQMELQKVQGNVAATNEIIGGISGAIGSASIASSSIRDTAAANKAKADLEKPSPNLPKLQTSTSGVITGG